MTKFSVDNIHIHANFMFIHILKLEFAIIWRWFTISAYELYMYERVATLDCDRRALIAQVYQFESESAYKAAVNLGSVQERVRAFRTGSLQ